MPNPTISNITAREILDSRGRPTVEADVELASGVRASASVPSGASTGRHEALELRDGDPARHRGLGVLRAVANITREIAPALRGMEAARLELIDEKMLELDGTANKSRLGANAILAVSLATARAAAMAAGQPMWQWLRSWAGLEEPPLLPLPMINIISGGAHAERNLDFQDFLIMPVGARDLPHAIEMSLAVRGAVRELLIERGQSVLLADEGGFSPALRDQRGALELLVTGIERAQLRPGKDVAIALDVAATQLLDPQTGKYELLRQGLSLTSAQMVDLLASWVAEYPIISIEDGLAEDDWGSWPRLTQRLGARAQIIGDDLFTTHPDRVKRGIELGAANAVLVKMNQIGCLTQTFEVVRLAKNAGFRTIISARSGETEDSALADLAVGCAGGQIKIGSLACSERLSKYNQLLRIHAQAGAGARFYTLGK